MTESLSFLKLDRLALRIFGENIPKNSARKNLQVNYITCQEHLEDNSVHLDIVAHYNP